LQDGSFYFEGETFIYTPEQIYADSQPRTISYNCSLIFGISPSAVCHPPFTGTPIQFTEQIQQLQNEYICTQQTINSSDGTMKQYKGKIKITNLK
jgi:hypothetical protein